MQTAPATVPWLTNVIGGPRECLRVATWDAYVKKVRIIRAGLGMAGNLPEAAEPVPAHVSDGRWVFDCQCGAAGLAQPEWGRGICVDCGTIRRIAFPANRTAIEAVLLARPSPSQRHFLPGAAIRHRERCASAIRGAAVVLPQRAETLLSLARENRDAGDPIVKRRQED